MSRVGIFGTSGMARETGDVAWELGLAPVYVARDADELAACSFPGQVILESQVDQHLDMDYVIGIGDNGVRERVVGRFGDRLKFTNLIHPTASFGKDQRQAVEARRGVIVCAGVRFTSHIQVGDFCIFNLNSTISHDVVVEDFVYVAPGAHVTGNVHLGQRCWIGTGAAINQGKGGGHKLRIGADTVVGAGAVVVKDCDPGAVYAGVPARRLR